MTEIILTTKNKKTQMILSFKTHFPWGFPTFFTDKIIASVRPQPCSNIQPKLHSIRNGQRWKPGVVIHMATGVRSKNYFQFNKGLSDLERVKSVQRIDILVRPGRFVVFIDRQLKYSFGLSVKEKPTTIWECEGLWMHQFALNDGFTGVDEFMRFFNKPLRNGQLIHWTDLKY